MADNKKKTKVKKPQVTITVTTGDPQTIKSEAKIIEGQTHALSQSPVTEKGLLPKRDILNESKEPGFVFADKDQEIRNDQAAVEITTTVDPQSMTGSDTTEVTTLIDAEATVIPTEEDVKDHVAKLSDGEILRQFLEDEGNKKIIVETALGLKKIFGGFWFDMREMMRRTDYKTIQDCLQILNLLKLGGHLVARMREGTDQAEEYKVVIHQKSKCYILERELVFHEERVASIKKELDIARERAKTEDPNTEVEK